LALDIREIVFRLRGATPVPFLLAALYGAVYNPVGLAAGALLAASGEALRVWAVRHAGGATRTRQVGAPSLVTSGPYGLVRNPLYLANMMLYTGLALGSGAFFPWLPLVGAAFFAIQYGVIISLEEEKLRELFGDKYGEYCRRVPRLFPGFRHWRPDGAANFRLGAALREERSTLLSLALSWSLLASRMIFFRQ